MRNDKKMRKENQIGWLAICGILLLYPVLPQYIYIFHGLNIANFMGAVAILCVVMGGLIYKWEIPYLVIPYFIYSAYYCAMYCTKGEWLSAVSYIMMTVIIPSLIIGFVNTKRRFETAVDLLIDSGFVLALFGIVESITKINLFQLVSNAENLTFFHEIRYGFLRIMGTFGQPISYGLYQVFVIALIIYRLKSYTLCSQKCFFLKTAYLLSIINIILTVSRIPIIACIVLHIFLLYKRSKKKLVNYLVATLILLLLLVIINDAVGIKIPLISDLLSSLGNVTFDSEINSGGAGDRFILWQWVALSVGDKWLFGKGISTEFAYKVYEWQTKTSIENQYLNVFFHVGIVGVALLLFSYVTVLIYAKRKDSNGSENCSFNLIFFSMMLIYFICELGVQETDITRMYCIWISLLVSYNRIERMEKEL